MKCLALSFLPIAAMAEPCAPHAEATAYLALHYGEARQSVGVDNQGNLIEMFSNNTTGSWTLTRTTPDMIACLVMAGGHYEATPAPLGEDG